MALHLFSFQEDFRQLALYQLEGKRKKTVAAETENVN